MTLASARIVHVLGSTGGGGAEKQALYLLQAMRSRLPGLELAYFRRGHDHLAFEQLGIPMHLVEDRRRLVFDWFPRAAKLRRLLDSSPPAVVHSWLYDAHLVTLAAMITQRHTKVLLAHRSSAGGHRDGRHLMAMRPLRGRIDHIVANSPAGAEMMSAFGVAPDRISVIGNGVPAERVAIVRPPQELRSALALGGLPLICSVTRADPTKDLPTLYRAFQTVRESRPDARLLLVGPTERDLVEFGCPLPPGALAVGFQKHPADYVNAADVVVVSSRTEGHSNAADEALLMGVPVVSTETGGHAPLVRAAGGRTVPVGQGQVLGRAVLELFLTPPDRSRVRALAAQELSIEAVASATVELYEHLLGA